MNVIKKINKQLLNKATLDLIKSSSTLKISLIKTNACHFTSMITKNKNNNIDIHSLFTLNKFGFCGKYPSHQKLKMPTLSPTMVKVYNIIYLNLYKFEYSNLRFIY